MNTQKKTYLTFLLAAAGLTASAQYQLANAGFEEWETVTYNKKSGEEPVNWNSFLDGTGSLKGTAAAVQVAKDETVRPGSTGSYSAKLTARNVLGVIAQGNLTTGCVNMGSITASDASGNYNYTDVDTDGKNQTFTGLPDAMKVWVMFSTSSSYKGKACAILHTKGYYQDPYGNSGSITATKVAEASNTSIASSSDWQELTIPFTYEETDATPAYALVSFATSSTPGKGNKNDVMYVDDIEMLYYSELTGFTYDGAEYTGTSDLSGVAYEASKLTSVTTNGKGATYETSYDESTAVLTITVKGNDISENATNFHTYNIQFKKPAVAKTTTYGGNLVVVVDGTNSEPQATDILLTEETDGTYTFSLKNFCLGGGEDATPVGNIVLSGLTMTESDGTQSLKTNQTITIAEGDDPDYEYWLGPMLGEVPVDLTATIKDGKLLCTIDIDMTEMDLQQMINVYFAPGLKAVGDQNAPTGEGSKTDFVFCRQFSTGWSTLCLPFDFDANDFVSEGVTVNLQEFTGIAQDGGLKFSKVSELQGTANTPYLIYVSEDASAVIYYSDTQLEKAEPKAVTFGAYGFTGNYKPSFDMQGKYGVATVEVDGTEVQKILVGGKDSYLDGLRAYFTSTTAAANGMAIHFDEGQTTGIVDARGNITEDGAAYNLQGVRVANSAKALPKGVYVVNGKKVIR